MEMFAVMPPRTDRPTRMSGSDAIEDGYSLRFVVIEGCSTPST